MDQFSNFLKPFFMNVSIMLTLMYLGSLIYKYLVYKLSSKWKEALFVILAIGCGWTTMKYGFRFSENVLFDMRFLAVIVAPLFVRNPLSILIIGLGIGLGRLSFGVNQASIVGALNIVVMSLIVLVILYVAKKRHWSLNGKMAAVILFVNTSYVAFIAAFGVIPAKHYLIDLAPASYLLSLFLSVGFVYLLREFMMEAGRKQKLQIYAARLEKQYRISEEKGASLEQAKQELEDKNRQVESASQYKTEFLANMSHELRTPLNSVLVLAQILEDNAEGRLSEAEAGYARIIRHSGKELLGLINDVLDLSKIEAGRMELDRNEFSMNELLTQAEGMFRPIADQKHLELVFLQDDGVPEMLYTDGKRLQQIVKNLLSNALKFTQRGRVTFQVSVVPEGALLERGGLAFTVEDTGIGIADSKQQSIFEAFFQADGTISRAYGGTGLGLSIARQFALLFGGDIKLESEEGKGSRFVLYVPWSGLLYPGQTAESLLAAERKMKSPASPDLGPASKPRSSTTVLVVDDDEHNVYSLRAALEAWGITVLTASNGSEALTVLAVNTGVDIVLMDIMMPGMDGLEATRRLRGMPGLAELPVIAVTSKAFPEDKAACMAAGASDYLSKPVDLRELLQRMDALVEGRLTKK